MFAILIVYCFCARNRVRKLILITFFPRCCWCCSFTQKCFHFTLIHYFSHFLLFSLWFRRSTVMLSRWSVIAREQSFRSESMPSQSIVLRKRSIRAICVLVHRTRSLSVFSDLAGVIMQIVKKLLLPSFAHTHILMRSYALRIFLCMNIQMGTSSFAHTHSRPLCVTTGFHVIHMSNMWITNVETEWIADGMENKKRNADKFTSAGTNTREHQVHHAHAGVCVCLCARVRYAMYAITDHRSLITDHTRDKYHIGHRVEHIHLIGSRL